MIIVIVKCIQFYKDPHRDSDDLQAPATATKYETACSVLRGSKCDGGFNNIKTTTFAGQSKLLPFRIVALSNNMAIVKVTPPTIFDKPEKRPSSSDDEAGSPKRGNL